MAKVPVHRLINASLLMLSVSTITSSTSLEKSWHSRKICKSKECRSAARYLRSSMNLDVDPCDNFYKYACGNWGKVYGRGNTFSLKQDKIDLQKLEFLKKKNSKDEHPVVHKARKYFSSCLYYDGTGMADYKKNSDRIENIIQKIEMSNDGNNIDYAKKIAHIARTIGYKLFFDLRVIPNPYNKTANMISLSDPDSSEPRKISWYRQNDMKSTSYFRKQDLREIIREKCQNMDKFDCIRVIQNQISSEQFTKLEQRKNIEKSATFLRNDLPKIYTLKQLQNISDKIAIEANSAVLKFNWTLYIEDMFANIGVILNFDDSTMIEIAIEDLNYIKLMIERIYQLDEEEMELIIFVEVYFGILGEFYYRIRHNKELENTCMEEAEKKFPLAVDYLYVQQKKYEKMKTKGQKLFNSIRSSFASIIQKSSWIEKQTRKRALDKLNRMKALIGFPDIDTFHEILDQYNNITVTKDFLNTSIAINSYRIQNELRRLNQINELDTEYGWIWLNDSPPSKVNAYYFPYYNIAVLPAALLEDPFFTDSLKVFDYGFIGFVMGHEMTHGFDKNGISHNESGFPVSWWDKKSAKRYDDKTKCFLEAYDKYDENSRLTIGEDVSDNGAFHETLLAYRTHVSWTPNEPFLPRFKNFTHDQLFTLAFAQTECADSYTSTQYEEGNHSSPRVRINEVCRNSAEFSQIWKCRRGSKMNPKKKCKIW